MLRFMAVVSTLLKRSLFLYLFGYVAPGLTTSPTPTYTARQQIYKLTCPTVLKSMKPLLSMNSRYSYLSRTHATSLQCRNDYASFVKEDDDDELSDEECMTPQDADDEDERSQAQDSGRQNAEYVCLIWRECTTQAYHHFLDDSLRGPLKHRRKRSVVRKLLSSLLLSLLS